MNKVYIYGLGERIWHWTQALAILVLLITGFGIHFLTPDGVSLYDLYNWHAVFGFVLIMNTFIGNIYFLSNHSVTQFIPYINNEFIDKFIFQIKYYLLGRFKRQKNPFKKSRENKLNPLQKIVYFGMLFIILPIQFLTGILLFFAKGFLSGVVDALGGLAVLSVIHVIASYIFLSFLIVHIYMTFLATPIYNYYLGMIAGYELEKETEESAK